MEQSELYEERLHEIFDDAFPDDGDTAFQTFEEFVQDILALVATGVVTLPLNAIGLVESVIKHSPRERVIVVVGDTKSLIDIRNKKVRLINNPSGIGIKGNEKFDEMIKSIMSEKAPEPVEFNLSCNYGNEKVPHHKRGFINRKGPMGRKPWR